MRATGGGDHADNGHVDGHEDNGRTSSGRTDGGQASSGRADTSFAIDDASVDLVIQNPPFTRPNGPEAAKLGVPIPSFAGFGTGVEEQQAMASRLRQLYKGVSGRAGHGNAGLASNFIDLSHAKVRPGGVIALVLPATFVSGNAWAAARDLLAREYRDITVVTLASSGADDRAFSADTGMAETLVIATRRGHVSSGADTGHVDASTVQVNWVSLRRRPENPVEAVTMARAVVQSSPGAGEGTTEVGASGSSAFLEVGGADGQQSAAACRSSQ